MKNSNNKETINLLDLLSDSDSDISDLDLTPRKKKVKRKHRSSATAKMKQTDSCGCSKSDMRIISLWFAAVLITFWLIALSWLAVILYGEIKRMDISIKSGSRGSVCRRLSGVLLFLLTSFRATRGPIPCCCSIPIDRSILRYGGMLKKSLTDF